MKIKKKGEKTMDLQIDLNSIITALGMLSTVIAIIVKLNPALNSYFQKGAPILAEIDDIIDFILDQFPNQSELNTINDILDKVLSELKQAGYKIDDKNKQKIKNRLKAKVNKKESLNLKFDPTNDVYKIEYNKEF